MGYERKDARYRQAKAEGYRARSAYKLIEMDRRARLLRPGASVLDLGAGPGGWLQVTAERVGRNGRVVGVDLIPIDPLPDSNVSCLTGDLRQPEVRAALREALGQPADVVLCDASPKLTGVRATDEARGEELTDAILSALPELLARGGSLLMKTFMRDAEMGLARRLRGWFDAVRVLRPDASRKGSAECYLLAEGFQSCR